MKENVKVKEFNVMGRIALSTVEFDIIKNGEVKTKKNNLATRCLDKEKFQHAKEVADYIIPNKNVAEAVEDILSKIC